MQSSVDVFCLPSEIPYNSYNAANIWHTVVKEIKQAMKVG